LAAGAEVTVNEKIATADNFEQVVGVDITANGITLLHMTPKESDGSGAGLWLVVGLGGGALLVLILLGLAVWNFGWFGFRSRKTKTVHEVGKSALRAKEIELEIERTKSEARREAMLFEEDKEKPVFCSYCGAKNAKTDKVCFKCGANLL